MWHLHRLSVRVDDIGSYFSQINQRPLRSSKICLLSTQVQNFRYIAKTTLQKMANSRRNFFSDFSVGSVKDIWNDLTGKTWNVGKLKRNAIKETNVGLLLLTIFEHCKISMAYWGEQVKLAHSGLAGQLPDGCPVPVPAPGANASARWNCLAVPCQCQV